MNSAFENENLDNQGQINDNVGQDEGANKEDSGDWKSQAKYFQSEKDKLYSENQKLKEYEQIGQMLESRPDIVNTITGMVQGGQSTDSRRVELSKDEFDPWEAYNDPASKSYKFRQQELQDSISEAVDTQMQGVNQQVNMNELKSQLSSRGLSGEQVQSFIDFASKNPAEYGIEGAIDMWRAVEGAPEENTNNPLDIIRQNQNTPQQAGILNGEQPVRQSDDDTMWKGILGATKVGNKLP